MKLILLRHGESKWNLENRFTGWTDVGLTSKGEEEAKDSGVLLSKENIEIDMVYTSVLKRAINTMNICIKQMNKNNIETLKKGLETDRCKTIQKFFFECVKNSKFSKNEYKFLKENFLIDSLPENVILTESLEYLSESNNSKLLMETKKDVLIINGGNDHFIEPILSSNKIYNNISVEIINNMGHMPFISYKDEIYNVISDFI